MRQGLLILMFVFACHHILAQDDSLEHQEDEEVSVDAGETEIGNEVVDPETLNTTRAYQAEALPVKAFDKQKWEEVTDDVDYNEAAAPIPEGRPISMPWAGPLLKVIAYIVIIGVVVFILYYIVKNVHFDVGIRKTETETEDLGKPVENIERLDVEGLLAQARREGNFKMAVRLYYLGLLKKLHARGVIGWKKDKTNHDYLMEVFTKDFYYRDLQRLTVSYESVWYGEHPLRNETFEQLSAQFETMYSKINSATTL